MKIIGLSQNIIWKEKHENFLLIEEKFKDLEADLFCFQRCLPLVST